MMINTSIDNDDPWKGHPMAVICAKCGKSYIPSETSTTNLCGQHMPVIHVNERIRGRRRRRQR